MKDGLKWLLVGLMLAVGVAADVYYGQVAWGVKSAIGIVWFVLVLLVAATTNKGQKAWSFVKAARSELRKVVWPSRQETIQTTMVVLVAIVIMALFLWGMDTLFMWVMGFVSV